MSLHLQVLTSMFPGTLLLDVDQIASCMKVSPGHIYNMVSAKEFPIKLVPGFGRGNRVSIVQMAKYLDETLLDPTPPEAPPPLVKRKTGRPRGTTKAGLQQASAFQHQLAAAVYKARGREILGQAVDFVEEMGFSEDVGERCHSELQLAKLTLSAEIKSLRMKFMEMSEQLVPFDPAPGYQDIPEQYRT